MKMLMDMQVEFSDEVLEKLAEKLPEAKAAGAPEGKGGERPARLLLKFEKFGGKISLSSKAE
ncbi:hypothetical protein [Oceanithermus sp.]